MIEVEADEKIIRVVRRHWIVLVGDILVLICAIAMPVILLVALHILPVEKIFAFSGSTFDAGSFFLFAWLTVVWMFGWNIWTKYYLNVLMVTDKRVFDIDQEGLFKRKSASFRIDRIQNVTVDQKGILQTLLDFGGIRIETASEENFVTLYIAHPYEIKKLINEMQDGTLDKSQEVHLHPDTLERIAPLGDQTTTAPSSGGNNLMNRDGL